MKKLLVSYKIKLLCIGLSVSMASFTYTQQEAAVNEHSSKLSPEEKAQFEKESDERISKTMSNPVTGKSIISFIEKIEEKIKEIGDKILTDEEYNQLKQDIIDALRAYKKLPTTEQTKDIKKRIAHLLLNLYKFYIQKNTVKELNNTK